jgi:CheY-like chemotaxis protein
MICHRPAPILLITPSNCLAGTSQEMSLGETHGMARSETRWVSLRAETMGEALRYLRRYRPDVLVLDVSKPRVDPFDHTHALRLIPEARKRVPGMPIVVLGESGDRDVERFARGLGASIFLPINGRDSRARARCFIESLHSRDGPVLTHGPPEGDGQTTPTTPHKPL